MRKPITIILGTLIAMVICGGVAFYGAILVAMELGLAQHRNFEFYAAFPWSLLVIGAGLVGFLTPAVVVWRMILRERN